MSYVFCNQDKKEKHCKLRTPSAFWICGQNILVPGAPTSEVVTSSTAQQGSVMEVEGMR